MNPLRVAIGTIRSGAAKTAETRNASDSLATIPNRSALNTENMRNLSGAVDKKKPAAPRAADGIIQPDAAAPPRMAIERLRYSASSSGSGGGARPSRPRSKSSSVIRSN
jgi:hypothetical protein